MVMSSQQDFRTPIMEMEKKDVLAAWNKTSAPFEVMGVDIKGRIMRTYDQKEVDVVPNLPLGEITIRIQIPGNVYEIQGFSEGSKIHIKNFFKINRREAFRLVLDTFQKAQVAFNYNRMGIIGKVEDISLDGLGFSGSAPLLNLKEGEVLKNVRVLLETKELEVDLEIRRVFQKDKVLVGCRFVKIHTQNGSGMIMSFINVSLYNRKKLEGV